MHGVPWTLKAHPCHSLVLGRFSASSSHSASKAFTALNPMAHSHRSETVASDVVRRLNNVWGKSIVCTCVYIYTCTYIHIHICLLYILLYKGCVTYNFKVIKYALLFIVNSIQPINSHRMLLLIFAKLLYPSQTMVAIDKPTINDGRYFPFC